MGKYRMNEPYGFEETFGFNSIRSEIDDEILKNKKTDAQQSEDITTEGEERAAADEVIDSRLDALEEQSETTSQLKEDFDAFTGTTYANDKAALEEKDSALEAKDTELEQSISDEAARAEAKEQEIEEAIVAEGERASAKEQELDEKVSAEADRAAAKEAEIEEALNVEAQRATAAESELEGKIVAEQARAEAKEQELEEAITNEENRAVAAEEALEAALENEKTQREENDTRIDANVSALRDDVSAKFAELDSKDAEIDAALDVINGDGDGSIKKAVADGIAEVVANAPEDLDTLKEIADYIASDKTKAAEIETKLSDHDSAIDALEAKDEELVAKDADLETAINEEAQRATTVEGELQGKDVELQAAIDAEIDRASDKEAEIEEALNVEAQRATAAESELEGKIVAEQARAEAKETELETAINTKTDKEMSGTNGKALIFNESDGGGAKFEHNDGTWSFAGVNDGGENGIAGQIYAVKKNASNKMEGTRIDVTKGAMYYTVGDASAADRLVADNEIAVKGDVAAVDAKVEAIDLTPYAKSEDVNAELANKANASDLSALNDAVGQLSSKVDEKAAQSDLEAFEASSTEALNAEVTRAEAKEAELVAKDAELEAEINDEATRATAAESELQGKITAEQARAEAKEAELENAIPEAAAQAVAEVVANAPEDLDTLKEIADYIASDKTKAAEVETKLAALEAKDVSQDAVINGKVDRNMNGTNGNALIFNESDGGGAKFEHNDGTWSFAGVNDGGENGIAGQLYVVKKNASNKMEGTRIDMTKGAMYYTVGDASAAERMVEANEIAVKGDIDAAVNAIEIPSIEGLAKSADVTAEIASAVAPLAVKADVDAALETKADADKVYTQDEVNSMLAEKQAEIDTMAADFKKLKEIVGDLGGAVEYSVPSDGKLTDMLKKSGVIKLTEDVESNTYAGGITSKNITTLNLNGKTITTTANTTTNPSIMVRGTQQFTIQGGGTLNANGHIAIEANGEDAVITLGGTMFGRPTYVTNREGELIYCYLGTINITNGVFRNDNENKAFLLNCYDANYRNGTAKIIVTGGKFYDFDPANNASEGEGTSYVPDGYVSVASTETIDGVEHTVYNVKKA